MCSWQISNMISLGRSSSGPAVSARMPVPSMRRHVRRHHNVVSEVAHRCARGPTTQGWPVGILEACRYESEPKRDYAAAENGVAQ